MISIGKIGGQTAENITTLYGLNKDVTDLPTEDIKNGSSFYAMDTFDVYMFDEENGVWILQD